MITYCTYDDVNSVMSVSFVGLLVLGFFSCFWKRTEIVSVYLNFGKFAMDTTGENNVLKIIWGMGTKSKADKQ